MKAQELIQRRLMSQALTSAGFDTAAEVVAYFGAMQSQDYAMAKWAVGMRMTGASDADVEKSVNAGEIIRTHILRPTWHFVNRDDVRWIMELSVPNLKKATQYVNKQVGLTDEIFKKAWKYIEAEFKHEQNLTKEDLTDRLAKKKIMFEGLLATQILIRAEWEMRICSGARKKNKIAYALFDRRVPASEKISRKDALVKLASVYFTSRGPATVKDFTWWSGLNASDAKFGIAGLGTYLRTTTVQGLEYLYLDTLPVTKKKVTALLPAFDEYMVGYTEGRDIAFPPDVDKSIVGNGVFKPVVLYKNEIAGTWKKMTREPLAEIHLLEDGGKYPGMNAPLAAWQRFVVE